MKKTATILCLLLAFAATASAQQLEKLFNKYMEDERFTYVYQKSNAKDFVLGERRQMLTFTTEKNASLEVSFSKELRNALKADNFELTSLTRDGKDRVEIYEKRTGKRRHMVNFIISRGSVMVGWNEYEIKKE